MSGYEYKPLDLESASVRFVSIQQGVPNDVIYCKVFEGWVDEEEAGMPYEALSYTWGDTEPRTEIFVDGGKLSITRNLFEALHQLRYEDQDRVMWIDAICINQKDEKERGHQVKHMSKIYKQAERVLIWLGLAGHLTDHVMDIMNSIQRKTLKLGHNAELDKQPALKNDLADLREGIDGLHNLLQRPWFRRIWTLQEVAYAQRAVIWCGKKYISSRTFAIVPRLVGIAPSPHCQAVLEIMPTHVRNTPRWPGKRDLRTLLVRFGESEASDPRDMVYALLNLSSDACESTQLTPDYMKSSSQVIIDTINFIISRHIDLHTSFNPTDPYELVKFLQNPAVWSSTVKLADKEEEIQTWILLFIERFRINHFLIDSELSTLLSIAAEHGCGKAVIRLIRWYQEREAPYAVPESFWRPAYLRALQAGKIDICTIFEDESYRLDSKFIGEIEAGDLLGVANSLVVVQTLLKMNQLSVISKETALKLFPMLAAQGDYDLILMLTNYDIAKLWHRTSDFPQDGAEYLFEAIAESAQLEHWDILCHLLDFFNVDAKQSQRQSLLQWAIEENKTSLVNYLEGSTDTDSRFDDDMNLR